MLAELHLAVDQFTELDSRLTPVLDRFLAARGNDQAKKQQLLDEAMARLTAQNPSPTHPTEHPATTSD